MRRAFFSVILSFICITITNAQVSLSMPDTTFNSAGGNITIPVKAAGFNNVAGFNFIVKFDPSVLVFQNLKSDVKNVSLNVTNGEVRVIYADINNPISIKDGNLINMNFVYAGGTSGLDITDADAGNTNAQPVSLSIHNGNISGAKQSNDPISLGGIVWYDKNNNGVKDSDEPGIRWVTVDIFNGNGHWLTYAMTDAAGQYSVDSLSPGSYFARFDLSGTNQKYKFIDSTKDSPLHNFTDTTAYSYTFYVPGGTKKLNVNAGLILKSSTGLSDQNSAGYKPHGFALYQNFPNPFNPSTTIQFEIPKEENVKLIVYNVLGQTVETLFNGEASPGIHSINFNADDLSSGIYFYRLTGENVNILKKMILAK